MSSVALVLPPVLKPSVARPQLTLAASNAANGSCPVSPYEVRDRGSPNRESQYTSQGLLVRSREAQLTRQGLASLEPTTFAK